MRRRRGLAEHILSNMRGARSTIEHVPSVLTGLIRRDGACPRPHPYEIPVDKRQINIKRTERLSQAELYKIKIYKKDASHQMMFYGIPCGCDSRSHCQFAVDRAHMEIDGDNTNDKPFSYLGTSQTLCKQMKHL